MDKAKLAEILAAHKEWRLSGGTRGARANLARADLADANLAGAYLADANLARADLARANLAGADLARANLAGANLADANLADANLADASQVIDAGTPNGWRCVGWMDKGRLSIRVGCRNKTMAEAREYWTGKDDRREVMAALDYVETVAKLRAESDVYWRNAEAKAEAA